MREVFSYRALLEHRLRLDLQELELDQVVVLRQITEAGKSLAGFGFAVVVHKPSGRERLHICKWMLADERRNQYYHEDHADEEDDSREEL